MRSPTLARTPRLLSSAVVIGFALATLSCSGVFGTKGDAHAPGTPLGVYALAATIDLSSQCNELVASAPRPWKFNVTLRRDGQTAYWYSGESPTMGTIATSGALAFSSAATTHVHDASKARQVGACDIVRVDDFAGSLAGDPSTVAGVASFTGTLRYTYSLANGADCSDVVGPVAEGRPSPIFAALPCEAHFSVSATRSGDVPSTR